MAWQRRDVAGSFAEGCDQSSGQAIRIWRPFQHACIPSAAGTTIGFDNSSDQSIRIWRPFQH
eukprot:1152211-Pelagomonas_calceolata.AAC.4